MRLRPTRNKILGSSSHGCDADQNRQEVIKCQDGDHHNSNKDEESLNGASKKDEENKVAIVVLGSHIPAAECPPLTIKDEIQEMLLRQWISQVVAQKLVEDLPMDLSKSLCQGHH